MSYIFFFFIFASRCCDFFLFFYFLLFICLTLTHSARCEYCARASGKHSPCKYMQIRNTHGGRTRVYIYTFFSCRFFFYLYFALSLSLLFRWQRGYCCMLAVVSDVCDVFFFFSSVDVPVFCIHIFFAQSLECI